jgi:hypothetical protein
MPRLVLSLFLASLGSVARADTSACGLLILSLHHAERYRRGAQLLNPFNVYRNFWTHDQMQLGRNLRHIEEADRRVTPFPRNVDELDYYRRELYDKILDGAFDAPTPPLARNAVPFYAPPRLGLRDSPGAWNELVREHPDATVATLLTIYSRDYGSDLILDLFAKRPDVLWLAVAEARLEAPMALKKRLRNYRYRLNFAYGTGIATIVASGMWGRLLAEILLYCRISPLSDPFTVLSCAEF